MTVHNGHTPADDGHAADAAALAWARDSRPTAAVDAQVMSAIVDARIARRLKNADACIAAYDEARLRLYDQGHNSESAMVLIWQALPAADEQARQILAAREQLASLTTVEGLR